MTTEETIYRAIRHNKEQDNVIPLRVEIIDICDGNIAAALMLVQLIYWTDRAPEKNGGWIWKSGTEWYSEVRLTRQATRTATNILTNKGLIETRLGPARGHRTTFYRISLVNITRALVKTDSALVDLDIGIGQIQPTITEPIHSLSENTTETNTIVESFLKQFEDQEQAFAEEPAHAAAKDQAAQIIDSPEMDKYSKNTKLDEIKIQVAALRSIGIPDLLKEALALERQYNLEV